MDRKSPSWLTRHCFLSTLVGILTIAKNAIASPTQILDDRSRFAARDLPRAADLSLLDDRKSAETNQNPAEPKSQDPATNNNQPEPSFLLNEIKLECELTISKQCEIFRQDSPQIQAITKPYIGKTATLTELQTIADKISELYVEQGYILSRGILVDQGIKNGVVVIKVIEGGIADIQVEGTKRVSPDYIKNRLRAAKLMPLKQAALEDRLTLLRLDPLFKNVTASLREGKTIGKNLAIVRVIEADPWSANIAIDNYSPPSVGSEQIGVAIAYRNAIGSGDRLAAAYKRSTTGGANLYDFGYSIPLDALDSTLQLRAAISDYKITDPQFAALNIKGKSNLYELNYRHALIRSPREEFALGVGFTFQDGQTFIFDRPQNFGIGPDPNGISRTSVLKFSQDYLNRDPYGAWSLQSQFNLGTGWFGATLNDRPTPDSRFFSWLFQGQRLQQLDRDNLLIASLDLQLTPNSLLPSQQFIIGGGRSLRGFRQNARYGDNGIRLSLEERMALQRNETGATTLQLAPFIDAGLVWNQDNNPNNVSLPKQNILAGIGLGVLWEPLPQLNVRVDYGLPLVNLDDRGRNLQDSGLYFNVSYGF